MMQQELIERLQKTPGVHVDETHGSWLVRIDKQHAKFEVIIPYDVLEWHVTAYNRQGGLFWQDWADYLGYEAAATTAALGTDMCHDIQRFVALLVLAEDFKIVETGTFMIQKTAQWKHAGEWCDVWPTSA